MSAEENKAVLRRVYEERNKSNLDIIDECFADDFKYVRNNGQVLDRGAYKQFLAGIVKGVPDIRWTMGDIVAEGDRVAYNFTWTGTDTGGIGAPATGKRLTINEAFFARFAHGKITEMKQYSDTLIMLQQGGWLPSVPEIIKARVQATS